MHVHTLVLKPLLQIFIVLVDILFAQWLHICLILYAVCVVLILTIHFRVVQFLLQGNQISTDGALHLLSLCDLLTLRCKLIAY